MSQSKILRLFVVCTLLVMSFTVGVYAAETADKFPEPSEHYLGLVLDGSNDTMDRAKAAQILSFKDTIPPGAVEQLMSVFKAEKDELLRQNILAVFRTHPQDSKEILPFLIGVTEEKNSSVRNGALRAIKAIDPTDKRVEAVFETLVKHDDPFTRSLSVVGLFQDDSRAAEVVPVLQRMLSDESSMVRGHAAEGLVHFGRKGKKEIVEAYPEIKAALKDEHHVVRAYAATAIGQLAKMGEDVSTAVPDLVALLEDQESTFVLKSALRALRDVPQNPEQEKALARDLKKHENPTVRMEAEKLIRELEKR